MRGALVKLGDCHVVYKIIGIVSFKIPSLWNIVLRQGNLYLATCLGEEDAGLVSVLQSQGINLCIRDQECNEYFLIC